MKDVAPVRVAMVGAGGWANTVHYPSLTALPEAEVVACCDLDPERLRVTADRYGIEGRYADYRRMVEETDPAAVFAIGPPEALYSVWTWCLSEGRNLYIEKPMGLTMHQARSLAWLAERSGAVTQVSFQRRSCPLVVLLREKCLERGPITNAVCEFLKCAPAPQLDARDHMMDDGVHAIDTVRWMCGGEVAEVLSVTRRVGTPDVNFIAALMAFSSGATGAMLLSWTSGRRVFRVQMHAPGIAAEAEHEAKGRLYADGDTTGVEFDTREVAGSDQFHVYGGFQAKHREFLRAVATGSQPSSCFADALRTMEVAETILAQARVRGD